MRKSRWPSWAPVPNKPTASVDVKQHSAIQLHTPISSALTGETMGVGNGMGGGGGGGDGGVEAERAMGKQATGVGTRSKLHRLRHCLKKPRHASSVLKKKKKKKKSFFSHR